jgi:D-alanyl-D-alanine carboxypeptidase
VNVADWQPGNSLFLLGQWLSMNAAKAGLVQAYTAGRAAGYAEEPWHFSYAPISIGLRQRYNQEVNLSKDVIDAVLGDFKQRASKAGETLPSDFEPALRPINVSDLVNAINPKL